MKVKKPKTARPSPLASRPSLTLVEHLDLDPGRIEPSPFQPRDDFPAEELAALANSLKYQGQIHAVAVRKQGQMYELLDGERRWRAGTIAGLKSLRAEVFDCTDQQARQIVLATAIHRQDLNPIEEARAYEAAIEAGDASGPTELAEQLGVSQGHVSNRIRLLDLPIWWQTKVIHREISERHARAVLPYCHSDIHRPGYSELLDALMNDLAAAIVRDELPSVAAWEKRVEVIVERVTKRMAGRDEGRGARDEEDTEYTEVHDVTDDLEEEDQDEEDAGADEDVSDTEDHAGGLDEDDEAAGMDEKSRESERPLAPRPSPLDSFPRDLYAWRCDWQRFLIAQELDNTSQENLLKIALAALAHWDGNGACGRAMADALDSLKCRKKDMTTVEKFLDVPLIDLERISGEVLSVLFWDDRGPSPLVPNQDVEAVCRCLEIDMQEAWEKDGEQAGPLSKRFWDLFDNEQLRKLHKKYKLGLDVSEWNRVEIIDALMDRRNADDAVKIPREILKARKA